ncbi:MAG TPA: hypothetical protein VL346_11790, partial [Acidobacteriaceae bacterium]|nr:hypothetical protein [Acidobacteriaceae bacterium]
MPSSRVLLSTLLIPGLVAAAALLVGGPGTLSHLQAPATVHAATSCSGDNAGLKLPSGFCATLFAEGIGHSRQLAVSDKGVVYVNTWSGQYFPAG